MAPRSQPPFGDDLDAPPFGDRVDAPPFGDDLDFGDRIELRGLRVLCVVGALPHERETPQPLAVDVDIYADLRRAGASDALADTIDYGAACERIVAVCTTARAQLLERLADLIAAELCATEGVTAVTVTVTKLRPPVAEDLATSAVRITRSRD